MVFIDSFSLPKIKFKTNTKNGDSVDVYGFEFAFQRQLDFFESKFLKGFGIYLNYTYTKSEAKGIAVSYTHLTLPTKRIV